MWYKRLRYGNGESGMSRCLLKRECVYLLNESGSMYSNPNISKRRETHRSPRFLKRYEDVSQSQNISERHEDVSQSKAARGHAAIQNISKRQ